MDTHTNENHQYVVKLIGNRLTDDLEIASSDSIEVVAAIFQKVRFGHHFRKIVIVDRHSDNREIAERGSLDFRY